MFLRVYPFREQSSPFPPCRARGSVQPLTDEAKRSFTPNRLFRIRRSRRPHTQTILRHSRTPPIPHDRLPIHIGTAGTHHYSHQFPNPRTYGSRKMHQGNRGALEARDGHKLRADREDRAQGRPLRRPETGIPPSTPSKSVQSKILLSILLLIPHNAKTDIALSSGKESAEPINNCVSFAPSWSVGAKTVLTITKNAVFIFGHRCPSEPCHDE